MSESASVGFVRHGSAPLGLIGAGGSFEMHEWSGSGPGYLHVHHGDDEAWHVLSGTLRFRFAGGETRDAGPGTTVFVPAGIAHDYEEVGGPSRYLIVLTPRLGKLIEALQQAPIAEHAQVLKAFNSEMILE